MNEKNDSALVPRPPSAVQKAAPGAKRILSGMVADTLALVKKEPLHKTRPLRIVMVNDEEGVLRSFEVVIRQWFKDVTMLFFDNGAAALEELVQTDPDLLITDDRMAVMGGDELCQRLLANQVTYPIIVDSAWEPIEPEWVREFASRGLNISFLHVPCDLESILRAVETALKIPRNTIENQGEIMARKTQPLRVVMIYSEPAPFKSLEIMIRRWFKNVTFIPLENSVKTVWDNLSWTDPDLLITADAMPMMRGEEIIRRLQKQKATYPIIVTSAFDPTEEWVRECASRGLNVRFLAMPFTIEDVRKLLEASLKIPLDKNHEP